MKKAERFRLIVYIAQQLLREAVGQQLKNLEFQKALGNAFWLKNKEVRGYFIYIENTQCIIVDLKYLNLQQDKKIYFHGEYFFSCYFSC